MCYRANKHEEVRENQPWFVASYVMCMQAVQNWNENCNSPAKMGVKQCLNSYDIVRCFIRGPEFTVSYFIWPILRNKIAFFPGDSFLILRENKASVTVSVSLYWWSVNGWLFENVTVGKPVLFYFKVLV